MSRRTLHRILLHSAAALTAIAGLYTLLGFIVVPDWVERRLPAWAERVGVELQVEDVQFNPYLLAVRLQGLQVALPDGTPVADAPVVSVDLGWSSIVRRTWMVQAVRVERPEVTIATDSNGQINLARLGGNTDAPPPATSTDDGSGLPPLVIASAVVSDARLHYIDARAAATPIDVSSLTLTAHDLGTRSGHAGQFHVQARLGEASLAAAGGLALTPFESNGTIAVRSLALAPLAAVAIRSDAIADVAGDLSAALAYAVARHDGTTAFRFTDLAATLSDFALRMRGADRPMAAWSHAAIVDAAVDLQSGIARIGTVAMQGGHIAAITDASGRLNFQRLADALAAEPKAKEGSSAWQVDIDRVLVQALALAYADGMPNASVSAGVARTEASFAASMRFGGASPNIVLKGMALNLHDVRYDLQGPTPMTARLDAAQLRDGNAQTGSAQWSAARIDLNRARIAFGATAAESPDIALDALRIDAAAIDAAQRIVDAKALRFDGLTAKLARGEQGLVGMPTSLVPSSEPETAPVGVDANAPDWRIRIAEVTGTSNGVRYQDRASAPPLQASLDGATVAMALEIDSGASTSVRVDGLDLELRQIAVSPADTEASKAATLASLRLAGASIDTGKQRLAAKRLTIDGADVPVERTRTGSLRIAGMELARDPGAPAAAVNDASAWGYRLDALQLNDTTIDLRIDEFDAPLTYRIALDGSVRNIDATSPEPMRIDASARTDRGGTLRAQARLRQDLAGATAQLNFEGLALAPFDPILSQYAALQIASGRAAGAVDLRYARASDQPLLRVEGRAALDDVLVNEPGRDQPFVAWKRVDAQGIQASVSPNRLDIASIEIVGPQAALVVTENRTLNLARVLRKRDAPSSPDASATDADADNATPFPISVGRVRLSEGRLQFADLSLVLPFSTRIHDLEGVVVGLSSAPGAQAELRLDGRIADYGSASANGTVNAFDPSRYMDISVNFDNVLIPPFSPYTATFAGRTIESGRVWLDLDYRVAQDKLSGENKIVVQDLKLGRKVEAPQAKDWPLDLALALLKDSNDRISMQIPVSGNVGDPEFDYGQVISNAIGTALRRIVSAPFRALASLFGGSGKDIEATRSVVFNPGSDRVIPTEEQQLAELAKALTARPNLRLIVRGPYDPGSDRRALREFAVRRDITKALGRTDDRPSGVPDPIVFSDPSTQEALEVLLQQRLSEQDYATFKRIIGPSDPQYYPAAFGEIAARVEITESRLQELANARAQAVADALSRRGIAPGRLAVGDARIVGDAGASAPRIAAQLDLDVYEAAADRIVQGS